MIAEPIRIGVNQFEYPVIPDIRRRNAFEVYSVDEVFSANPAAGSASPALEPLYSWRKPSDERTRWSAVRRPSQGRNELGTDVYLSFAGGAIDADLVTVKATVSNGDLPVRLQVQTTLDNLELDLGGAVTGRFLMRPSAPVRPPLDSRAEWQLVSALNFSLARLETEGHEALKRILSLLDFSSNASIARQIDAIRSVTIRPASEPLTSIHGVSFCAGTRIDLEFDEDYLVGTGLFLFATVLERFFAGLTPLNSFTALTVRSSRRKEVVRQWPPRIGDKPLI